MTFALAFLALSYALWRLRTRPDNRVRFYDMMQLRGVHADRGAAQDLASAERRCAGCNAKRECDELMRAGGGRAYARFCPNALYIEWLRATSLEFS